MGTYNRKSLDHKGAPIKRNEHRRETPKPAKPTKAKRSNPIIVLAFYAPFIALALHLLGAI